MQRMEYPHDAASYFTDLSLFFSLSLSFRFKGIVDLSPTELWCRFSVYNCLSKFIFWVYVLSASTSTIVYYPEKYPKFMLWEFQYPLWGFILIPRVFIIWYPVSSQIILIIFLNNLDLINISFCSVFFTQGLLTRFN